MSAHKQKGFTLMSTALKGNRKGFTLIELLVVMTIVAILMIIGFALYESAQSAARDTKRRSDMDSIASALEQNYNAFAHTYSALSSTWFQSGIPTDPNNTGTYVYTYAVSGGGPSATIPDSAFSSYVICALLENKNGNASENTNATAASGTSAIYYCRKNLQAF